MTTKGGHLNIHERIERQRFQELVELGRAFDLEDADVGPFARNTPQMQPFAFPLKFSGVRVLAGAELLDLFRIDIPPSLPCGDRDSEVAVIFNDESD